MNAIRDIETEANKLLQLINDLSYPPQNPAYTEVTKEEIIEILKGTVDVLASAQTEIEDLSSDLEYYIMMSESDEEEN